jgi:predicted anti-sigma-YlaC factor YlaD
MRGIKMKVIKSQCSFFKDLYIAFVEGKVEEETTIWMEQHIKECSYCRDWSKSVDEGREDKIYYEALEKDKYHEAERVVKKVKVIITLSLGVIALMLVWMSGWPSD